MKWVNSNEWKSKLKDTLAAKLPGKQAHVKMVPNLSRLQYAIPDNAFHAAVLMVLIERNGRLFFPVIKRAEWKETDVHKGQVSLPGGRRDEADADLIQTAFRECEEEIGLEPRHMELMGALSEIYIPVSNYLVYPFLAVYHKTPEYHLQTNEVSSVHEFPLEALINLNSRSRRTIQNHLGEKMVVPVIEWNDLVVWGATSMILQEFYELLINADLSEITNER